jgi:hypothetical protein
MIISPCLISRKALAVASPLLRPYSQLTYDPAQALYDSYPQASSIERKIRDPKGTAGAVEDPRCADLHSPYGLSLIDQSLLSFHIPMQFLP